MNDYEYSDWGKREDEGYASIKGNIYIPHYHGATRVDKVKISSFISSVSCRCTNDAFGRCKTSTLLVVMKVYVGCRCLFVVKCEGFFRLRQNQKKTARNVGKTKNDNL